MARASTTSDVFNAIAEPMRRRILVLLKTGERAVGDIVDELRIAQPSVSKHLRVLREVGLVEVRDSGRQRFYSLDARGLKDVHEWVGGFAEFWSESFDRLEAYVGKLQREEESDDGK